jgi:hypothetical protein
MPHTHTKNLGPVADLIRLFQPPTSDPGQRYRRGFHKRKSGRFAGHLNGIYCNILSVATVFHDVRTRVDRITDSKLTDLATDFSIS